MPVTAPATFNVASAIALEPRAVKLVPPSTSTTRPISRCRIEQVRQLPQQGRLGQWHAQTGLAGQRIALNQWMRLGLARRGTGSGCRSDLGQPGAGHLQQGLQCRVEIDGCRGGSLSDKCRQCAGVGFE